MKLIAVAIMFLAATVLLSFADSDRDLTVIGELLMFLFGGLFVYEYIVALKSASRNDSDE